MQLLPKVSPESVRFIFCTPVSAMFSTAAFLPQSGFLMPLTRKIKSMTLNFGPNHPAAHGILKLVVQIQGEVLQRLDPQFGFLHRGTEKLVENRNYYQNLPYFDRFDYVANLFQEHAYCLAVEELGDLAQPRALEFCLAHVRVLFDELSRLLNHLLTMSATCLDLGSMGPIFWAFEERERLMELYERASGARMHTALYKPSSIDWAPLTYAFFLDLSRFLTRAGRAVSGAVMGLINNKVLKTRLGSVGMFSTSKVQNYGISGVIARSGGVRRDLRLQRNVRYGAYWSYSLRTFLGRRGDNLDRFILRIKESFEVFRTASQSISFLSSFVATTPASVAGISKPSLSYPAAAVNTAASLLANSAHAVSPVAGVGSLVSQKVLQHLNLFLTHSKFTGMEELITHFKASSDGVVLNPGISYGAAEGPKGEIGVTLVSTGYTRPYRMKVRTPVSHNMHLIPSVCAGYVFGDFVMSFCSLDIVLGEIDR